MHDRSSERQLQKHRMQLKHQIAVTMLPESCILVPDRDNNVPSVNGHSHCPSSVDAGLHAGTNGLWASPNLWIDYKPLPISHMVGLIPIKKKPHGPLQIPLFIPINRWLLIPTVWWLNWLLLQLQDLLLQRFPLLSQRDLTPRICAGALLALPKCGPRTIAKLLEINIQNLPFCTSSNSQLGETQPSYIQGPPPYRRWNGRRVKLCLSLDAELKWFGSSFLGNP